MSFSDHFHKTSGVSNKTDIELQYKANKHTSRAIRSDKLPVKGGAIGALMGGAAGGVQMARGKYGKWKALGSALLGSAGGSGVGYAKKKYHSNKAFKYSSELLRRGYFPDRMDLKTGHVKWKPMPRYKSEY